MYLISIEAFAKLSLRPSQSPGGLGGNSGWTRMRGRPEWTPSMAFGRVSKPWHETKQAAGFMPRGQAAHDRAACSIGALGFPLQATSLVDRPQPLVAPRSFTVRKWLGFARSSILVLSLALSSSAHCQDPITVPPPAVRAALTQEQMGDLMQRQIREADGKLKPQMGWSSWNYFKQLIDEQKIMAVAQGMKLSGLVDAGYVYLNLDDCWQASSRSEDGHLQFDAGMFPSKEGLVKKINALGMKLGLYSSAGALTCEDMPGSLGFEKLDALTFARWGVEYLKYDWCHVADISTDANYGGLWPTDTPPILYLGLAPLKGNVLETRYAAADTAISLTGAAKISKGMLMGLGNNGGTAVFAIDAPLTGKYALSIGYEKTASDAQRFAMAKINGADYEIWFPRSTDQAGNIARVDVEVLLEAGPNKIAISNPITGQTADTIIRYSRMGNALIEAARETPGAKPIFFSICEHGRSQPWTWAKGIGSSWRIGGDINANWSTIVGERCYGRAVGLWEHQAPGSYNDPDMLEVGNGNLSPAQNRAHFALWAILNAPLILAMPPDKFDDPVIGAIIKNSEIIALNQDDIMLQAKRISTAGGVDVLIKPLAHGEAAICFFNKDGGEGASAIIDLSDLHSYDSRVAMLPADEYMVKDLWAQGAQYQKQGRMLNSGPLAQHDTAVFRVSQSHPPSTRPNNEANSN